MFNNAYSFNCTGLYWKLILLIGVIFLASCTGSKVISENSDENGESVVDRPPPCDTRGVVRNYSGLSGCSYLIEVEGGDLYLPSSWPDRDIWAWEEGQIIRFGYVAMEDMASICMREKKVIAISCLELYDLEKCVDTEDPLATEWMRNIFDDLNPAELIKYQYEGKPVYFFHVKESDGLVRYLYNCEGVRLCLASGGDLGNCGFFIERLRNPVTIFPKTKNLQPILYEKP